MMLSHLKVVFLMITVWFLATMTFLVRHEFHTKEVTGLVMVVGGCNSAGQCGVTLSTGVTCIVSLPVPGQIAKCDIYKD